MWERFEPGDQFIVSTTNGDGSERRTFRFVSWDGETLALYDRLPVDLQGTVVVSVGGTEVSQFDAADLGWPYEHLLHLVRAGDSFVVEHQWDSSWMFLGWRVELQSPLRSRRSGYETRDWPFTGFDVDPDGSFTWHAGANTDARFVLDEDTLAHARRVAGQVRKTPPWPTGWEDWRAPSHWASLCIPTE